MRKVLLSLVLFICLPVAVFCNADSTFKHANEAYAQKDYQQAISLYSDMLSAGYQSPTLYYNLANAYFKNDQLAQSILWYERALRLDPSNKDIQYNLAFANQQIVDEMEVLPEFFLKKWIYSLSSGMSSSQWAKLSIVFCFLLFGSIIFILLSSSTITRKIFFFSSCFFAIILAFSVWFTILQHKKATATDEAIVTQTAVTVKSIPDESGTNLFTIHEGIKVILCDKANKWIEVSFPNGSKGWVPEDAIEVI